MPQRMSNRLEDIAERNRRALRGMQQGRRRPWISFVVDEIRDAFDSQIPREVRRPKQLALAIVALLVVGVVAAIVLWPRGANPGGTVQTRHGDKVELASLWKDRRVVMVFYPGRGEGADVVLQALDAARARIHADVVAITSQAPAVANDLHERLKLGYEIYVDPTFQVMRDWRVRFTSGSDATTWAVFVVEPGGKVSFKQIGEPLPSWDELAARIDQAH